MNLNHEAGYIWTALTPDIKPMVEEGGEGRRVVGTRPSSLEGCGCAAVYFGTAPGSNSGRRQRTKQGITFTFTAEKAASHSWPEASSSSSSHPAKLILLIDLFGM